MYWRVEPAPPPNTFTIVGGSRPYNRHTNGTSAGPLGGVSVNVWIRLKEDPVIRSQDANA